MRWTLNFPIFALMSLASCAPGDLVSDGPLAKQSDDKIFQFSDYPPLKPNKSDAIRVLVSPSFGIYNYAFDIVPLDSGCRVLEHETYYAGSAPPAEKRCGNAMVHAIRSLNSGFDHLGLNQKPLSFQFVVPAMEYESFYLVLKSKMERWDGSWRGMTDGTSTAIELHSGGKISSYHSNLPLDFSPDNPAAFASLNMRLIALAYAPTGLTPRDPDWTVRPPKVELLLNFAVLGPE